MWIALPAEQMLLLPNMPHQEVEPVHVLMQSINGVYSPGWGARCDSADFLA